MFQNKYAGKCEHCKVPVAAGEDFAFKSKLGAWKVVCTSAACARALGLQAETGPAKRVLLADGSLIMPYEPNNLALVRAMPGARWNPEKKHWTVSLEIANRARVLEIASQLALDVAPELKVYAKPEAQVKATGRAMSAALFPFQVSGVEFLASRKRTLLADDMGLGKTVQALMALADDARVFVICPNSLKYNWQAEIRRWRPEFAVEVLAKKQRELAVPEPKTIVILNYDIMPPMLTDLEGKDYSDCTLIIDEAQAVKNPKAERSKRITRLADACGKAWFLTGTPLMNKPQELYGLLSAGGMAREVFGGWMGFVRCFNGYRGRWGWEFGSPNPEVPERLRRVMMRRTKEEVMPDLPSKIYKEIIVNNIGDEVSIRMDEIYADWMEDCITSGDFGGLPDFTEMSSIRADLAESRIPAMFEVVEQFEDSATPLLVFSAHRAPIDALADREGWAVITGDTAPADRQAIVEKFQAGQLLGVGLTIRAGGFGLTLTHASNVLFVDLDWTPAANSQAEDRVRRIGQRASSIQIMRMVSNHPLDLHVQDLLSEKIKLFQAAIETRVKAEAPKVTASLFHEESDADAEARRQAAIEAEQQAQASERQEQASERVDGWLEREQAKQHRVESRLLTEETVRAIRMAMASMLSVCDGALTLDGQGFGKSDAACARWVDATGMKEEKHLRLAWMMLSRYHRQLANRFPILFKEEVS